MPDLTKSYLVITEVASQDPNRKTKTWTVGSVSGNRLGQIQWHGAWRQYCFSPSMQTIFNHECLKEISKFCFSATADHREKLAMKKVGGE